ncbi:sugar ABC transporter substrate-binding protein [Actinocrispum sp. NPDC049592]|uniref:ABC transporter substrate-binding protein n=1 Tax=Actinocrispum sp. NPDC049592 TaxID=3154835 RepID=UPI0034205FBC
MPSRRSVLAAGLALPFLGACSPSTAKSASGPVEITFWSALRGSQPVVDAFNKSQNKIKVVFQQIPGGDQGGYAKLSNAARAGNAPDVCTIEYPQLPGFAIDGVATDLTSLMSDRLRAQVLPQALRLTTFDNKIFSIPFDVEPMVMHYRGDLFEKFGLHPPATWDEFAELARTVRQKDARKRAVLFATDGFMTYAAHCWQAGAQWFDISGGAWNVSMADAPTRKVSEYWQKLVDEDLVWVNPGASKQSDAQIGNGQVLVRFSGAWDAAAQMKARPKQKGQWRIAPLPVWDKPVLGTQGGSTFAISKDSKRAEAAMAFIEWQVTNPDSLKARLTSGASSAFPAYPALVPVGNAAFDRAYYGGQDIYKLFAEEAEKIRDGWTWGPRMSATQRVCNDGFAHMSGGDGTIIDSLRAAQDGTIPDLKSLGLSTTEHSS